MALHAVMIHAWHTCLEAMHIALLMLKGIQNHRADISNQPAPCILGNWNSDAMIIQYTYMRASYGICRGKFYYKLGKAFVVLYCCLALDYHYPRGTSPRCLPVTNAIQGVLHIRWPSNWPPMLNSPKACCCLRCHGTAPTSPEGFTCYGTRV